MHIAFLGERERERACVVAVPRATMLLQKAVFVNIYPQDTRFWPHASYDIYGYMYKYKATLLIIILHVYQYILVVCIL